MTPLPVVEVHLDLDASITHELVAHLQKLDAKCFFSATSCRSNDVNRALLAREADIALSTQPPFDTDGFDLFPLLQEPFIVVTAPGLVDPKMMVRNS